ncbi:putative glycolipid permease LtaA [Paenibacillus auburnensis]|jgi:MFS transporter, DHA1 family, multidrug resistance protein|uniref:Glycolipid permease LtaA n=1 Tax=Paenibacillus auburnensis TaxID=2905649 RepID=A0ABM9BN06_9BACL|nr:MFS transporter [Paenibacillus auburnensis]CAH1190701.1 putative glycolipid permease LtaA [Paenibacillus auburnensis]
MSGKVAQRMHINLASPFIMEMWVIIFLVEFVKGSLLVALLPVYMENILGLSVTVVGFAFALQYLGDNLFRSPFGWVMERIGYRWTMTGALALILVAVGMIIYAKDAVTLSAACLILGIGTSPLWPCTMTGITELAGSTESGSSGAAMGAVEMASLAGTGIGPIVVNFMMDHGGQSYRFVFLVLMGCAAAVAAIALLLPSRIGGQATHVVRDMHGDAPEGERRPLQPLKSLKRTMHQVRTSLKVSRLLFPALFLQAFAIGLMTPVVTLFTRAELHVTPNQFSLLLIAGGGITVLALIPAGKLVDRIGTTLFLNIGFLLAACSLAFFSQVRWLPLAFVAVALVGISYALILPAWNAFLAKQVPKGERGTVWGLFLTLQGSGMVAGPVLSGKLWDSVSHSAPFLASAAVMVLLFGLHLLIVHRTKLKHNPS